MPFEDLLAANTAASNRVADAIHLLLEKGGFPASVPSSSAQAETPAVSSRGNGRVRTTAPPAGPSLDDVRAVATELAKQKGTPVAAKLISKHGADKLVNMKKEEYANFIAAAEVILKGGNPDEGESDDMEL